MSASAPTPPPAFSESEVIRRVARRMGVSIPQVETFLATYADEYIGHARETDPELIGRPEPVVASEPAAKPATKPRTPRKSRAKGTSPAKAQETAEGSTEANVEAVGSPS